MDNNEVKVSINVTVTSDRMKAALIIEPNEDGITLSEENILNELKKKKITFGIDDDNIKNIIKNPVFNTPIVVAKGVLPTPGSEAKLIFHFNIKNELKPKELPDGRVDYKDLGIVQNVKKDDILVTLVDAVDGQDGRDVFGNIIKAPKQKRLNLPRGKNTYIDQSGHTLKAAKDGQVVIIEGKVTVLDTLTINSNVDMSTGNITFVGNVYVHGSVLSGFKIFAEGNVEVEGIVEAAEIEAKGDVILHKGITGMGKGKIISHKNVIAKFIENAYVSAKKDIQAEAIVHSQIRCGEKLQLIGRKASIVGGNCKVGKEIEAKVIGSLLAISNEIEVGIDPIMIERFHNLKKEIAELKENIKKLEQGIEILKKYELAGALNEEKREMLTKFTRSKILSNEKLSELSKEFEEIEKKLEERNEGIIRVFDVIYPNVKITIGSVCKLIKEPIKYCKLFRMDADIKIEPYS